MVEKRQYVSAVAAAVLTTAVVSATAPGAQADDLGEPDVRYAYNNGDAGAVAVLYDIPPFGTGTARTIQAQCAFGLMPAVNTSSTSVIVTGTATAHRAASADGTAAGTGVRCELRTNVGTTVVEAALPGTAVAVHRVVNVRLGPITLCVSASALWSDAVYQTGTAVCVSR